MNKFGELRYQSLIVFIETLLFSTTFVDIIIEKLPNYIRRGTKRTTAKRVSTIRQKHKTWKPLICVFFTREKVEWEKTILSDFKVREFIVWF